jgi:hypothetical protein
LFKEINVGLILVIFQKLRGFFEAYVAWSTAIVDVPFARDVFFEDAGLVSHWVRKIHTSWGGATLERIRKKKNVPGAGVEPARGFLPKGF